MMFSLPQNLHMASNTQCNINQLQHFLMITRNLIWWKCVQV